VTRRSPLFLLAALAAACHSGRVAPECAAGHGDSSRTRDAWVDTLIARLPPELQESERTAACAALRVDTIVVSPESLTIHVGEQFLPRTSLRIEGRTAAGKRVDGFAPFMDIEDRLILDYGSRGMFIGVRPGRTKVLIKSSLSTRRGPGRWPVTTVIVNVLP